MAYIDCQTFASILKKQTKDILEKEKLKPQLDIFTFEMDVPSKVYVQNKIKACEAVGIKPVLHRYPLPCTETDAYNFIEDLYDISWGEISDGVIVQKPFPSILDSFDVESQICPLVDVDGFSQANIAKLYRNDPTAIIPATTRGILELLKWLHPEDFYDGKRCVVLGRSELVGKPTSLVLMDKLNMTVTTCHSHTKDLAEITKEADVLVSAMGKPLSIDSSMVKPGSIVLDVGISRVDGKLCGDVRSIEVSKVAYVTPVPKGMGLLTVACLLENVVDCAKDLYG